jgi:hypothetical protein
MGTRTFWRRNESVRAASYLTQSAREQDLNTRMTARPATYRPGRLTDHSSRRLPEQPLQDQSIPFPGSPDSPADAHRRHPCSRNLDLLQLAKGLLVGTVLPKTVTQTTQEMV